MQQQPQLVLLQKTMAVSEGVGRVLNPNLNIWQLAQPLVEGWIRANLGPEARARQVAADGLEMLQRIPPLVSRVERLTLELEARTTPDGERHERAGRFWLVALAAGMALGLALARTFG